VEPKINLWKRWSQKSTFGKGCAKNQPLEKVEPKINLWERLCQKSTFAK